GSVTVGQHVMTKCAEHVRPMTLELGGKSPQVVFDDADMDTALPVIMNAIYQHAGQTCTAGSRLLVQENVYEKWLDAVVDYTKNVAVGPAKDDSDVGPLSSAAQVQTVVSYIDDAKEKGARVLVGGKTPDHLD